MNHMEKIIVYGTGNYCDRKIKSVKGDVIAFCDRKEGVFRGKKVIPIENVAMKLFDRIVVMVNHTILLDVIADLIGYGVQPEKIELSIMTPPRFLDELELTGEFNINKMGKIEYISSKKEVIEISDSCDWEKVIKQNTELSNVDLIRKLGIKPVSKTYGSDRGGSVVRYYISDFIEKNRKYIHGDVLEIGDNQYSKGYCEDTIRSHVLLFGQNRSSYYIGDDEFFVGDLMDGSSFLGRKFDCVILTQVLNFVEDFTGISDILLQILTDNGVALITVSGITPICRADMEEYGQYWSFTDRSILKMFNRGALDCEISTYGNFKTTCAFLAGMGCADIDTRDIDFCDEDYQLVIGAVVRKSSIR